MFRSRPASRPPGPATPLWGLGHLWEMRRDFLDAARRMQLAYGDMAYAKVGYEHMYHIFHPDWAREVLLEKQGSFNRQERFVQIMSQYLGQGLSISDGGQWQRLRRLLQPGFGSRRMAGYARMVVHSADQALHTLKQVTGQPVNVEQTMTSLTMQVILHTLFSHAPDGQSAQVSQAGDAVRVLMRHTQKAAFYPFDLPEWLPHKARNRRALKVLDGLIWHEIRQRQSNPNAANRGDLLDMLLSVREEDVGDTTKAQQETALGGLSLQEVRDQCMNIFLAGHDTSAAALTWWCWLMASHPECAQRASDEVDAVLGRRLPTGADMVALPYLGQTLSEAMRMYPPAPMLFTRRTREPVRIGPWALPKGALVTITPWVMHHDPRWFPEPHLFRPERFEPAMVQQLPRGAYMPFGAGPRVCIASQFATMEMTLVAAMLLQRFRLAALAGHTPEPEFSVIFRSKNGVYVSLTPRDQTAGSV